MLSVPILQYGNLDSENLSNLLKFTRLISGYLNLRTHDSEVYVPFTMRYQLQKQLENVGKIDILTLSRDANASQRRSGGL